LGRNNQMVETNKTTQLSYESYCRLRQGNEPAIKVYQVWKEHQLKRNSTDTYQLLGEVFTSIMLYTLTVGIIHDLYYINDHKIWITSPSGNTTRQLPLYQALRVIRKRKWHFAKVTLAHPSHPISRKAALRILLFRHNGRGQK